MKITSTPPVDMNDIYNKMVNWGYTGGNDLVSMSQWAGWTSPNPDGLAPYDLLDFLGAYTRDDIELTLNVNNNTGNAITITKIDLYSGSTQLVISKTQSVTTNAGGIGVWAKYLVKEDQSGVGLVTGMTANVYHNSLTGPISGQILWDGSVVSGGSSVTPIAGGHQIFMFTNVLTDPCPPLGVIGEFKLIFN